MITMTTTTTMTISCSIIQITESSPADFGGVWEKGWLESEGHGYGHGSFARAKPSTQIIFCVFLNDNHCTLIPNDCVRTVHRYIHTYTTP